MARAVLQVALGRFEDWYWDDELTVPAKCLDPEIERFLESDVNVISFRAPRVARRQRKAMLSKNA
jgi:hypothetical protein